MMEVNTNSADTKQESGDIRSVFSECVREVDQSRLVPSQAAKLSSGSDRENALVRLPFADVLTDLQTDGGNCQPVGNSDELKRRLGSDTLTITVVYRRDRFNKSIVRN